MNADDETYRDPRIRPGAAAVACCTLGIIAMGAFILILIWLGTGCKTWDAIQPYLTNSIPPVVTQPVTTNPPSLSGTVVITAYDAKQHAHAVRGDEIIGCAANGGPTVRLWSYRAGQVAIRDIDCRTKTPKVQNSLCPSVAVDRAGGVHIAWWWFAFEIAEGCHPWRLYIAPGKTIEQAQWIDEASIVGPELWEPWQVASDGASAILTSYGCRFWTIDGTAKGPASYWSFGNGGEKNWLDLYDGKRFAATGGCRKEGGNKFRVSGMPSPVIWQGYAGHEGQGDDMAAHPIIIGQSDGRAAMAQYNKGVYVNVWTGSALVYPVADAKCVSLTGNSGTVRLPPALCRYSWGWYLAYSERGQIVRHLIGADGAIGAPVTLAPGARPQFDAAGKTMVWQNGAQLCLRGIE